ncbi:MAG: outer membrane beta-barrel protein [Pseudomonadota bacterium]
MMKGGGILAIVLGALALPALAETGDQYLIARLSMLQFSVNDADAGYGVGLYYGMGVWRDLSVEFEVNKSLGGGAYKSRQGQGDGKFDLWTGAAYAAYRVPVLGNSFVKGKFGGLYESISNNAKFKPRTTSGLGMSGGAGVGYSFANGATLEGEYTLIEKDIGLYGLGMHYQF